MLIYGNRATKTGHQSLFGIKCPHCQTKDSLEMYTFSRYAHLFWIPMFPYKKEAVTQCNHCKQVLNKKEFTSDLMQQYEEMQANTKKPLWQFAGLGVFGGLIALGVYTAAQDDKKDITYLSAPKTGDVYEIKLGYREYTLYKVSDVLADSVYVMPNQFQTNKQSGLSKTEITKASSFIQDEYIPIAKKDLAAMKEKGEIISVNR